MTGYNESEKTLERKLVRGVEERGGTCVKLTSQYHRGLPDRMCLLPHHLVYFVEMKSTGRAGSPLQKATIALLRELGFYADIVDSSDKLRDLFCLIDMEMKEYV